MTGRRHIRATLLAEAYTLLHASSPKELAEKFIAEDQRLLQAHAWDYKNQKLVLNKVKEIWLQ